MTVLVTATHDHGGTSGPYDPADDGYALYGSNPTYSSDAAHGQASIEFSGGFSTVIKGAAGAVVGSCYFRVPSSPSNNTSFMDITNGVGNILCSIQIQANRNLRLKDSAGITRGGNLGVIGTGWHRLEYKVRNTTGTTWVQQARIYDYDSATPLIDSGEQIAGSVASVDNFRFGLPSLPNALVRIDSVRLADDWTGPWVESEPPAAVPYFVLNDGGVAVPLDLVLNDAGTPVPLTVDRN